jgi:sulfur-oxidizing protein SoxZ
MARTLVNVPRTAQPGEVIEIKAMIAHPMETGYRVDAQGQARPRHIIRRFACVYDGAEVFAADFHPAVSANPFVAFTTVATRSGALTFSWTDDRGATVTATAEITVG